MWWDHSLLDQESLGFVGCMVHWPWTLHPHNIPLSICVLTAYALVPVNESEWSIKIENSSQNIK